MKSIAEQNNPTVLWTINKLWASFTITEQTIILTAYGIQTLGLFTRNPKTREIVLRYPGGAPSWSKEIQWAQGGRHAAMVDWIERLLKKIRSGHPEEVVTSNGHFAQVLVMISEMAPVFSVADILIHMEVAIKKACEKSVSYAGGFPQEPVC